MPGLFDGTPLELPVNCDRCGREQNVCACPTKPPTGQAHVAVSDQSPRVRRERRRGKWSTIIGGLQSEPTTLKQLLSQFRTRLGVGGGLSNGELVLQGDHREVVVEQLCAMGYQAKASGG
jgi:translation initiation factor 1